MQRSKLTAHHRVPIDGFEPRVALDGAHAGRANAQTERLIAHEYLHQHVVHVVVHASRYGHRGEIGAHDALVQFASLSIAKRREAGNHLEHQDPERPYIRRARAPLVEDELRGEIIRRSADCVRALALFQFFRKTEIADGDGSVRSQEEIFRFHVAIHVPGVVNVLQAEQHLCGVDLDLPDPGQTALIEQVEHVADAILHDQIQRPRILK